MMLGWLVALFFAALCVVLGLRLRVAHRAEPPVAAIDAAALTAEATARERERIYNDLHDDLGAKLLELVYAAESPAQADRARALLADLRDVVTRSRGAPGSLHEVLAEIHSEAMQRLRAAGITLAWEDDADLPDPALERAHALHLYRIVREAISNVIRHAEASRLRVRVRASGDRLQLELTDDGSGGALAATRPGSGMRTMRERAAQVAGEIRWTPGTEGGTKVLLAMPLAGPIDAPAADHD